MGAQAIQRSFKKLDVHFTSSKIIDTAVDNPTAFLAKPWLLLSNFENEFEDSDPMFERGVGLEKDGRFDDRFGSEQATEEVIALLLEGKYSLATSPYMI